MTGFTHIDSKGSAVMVDVGDKPETEREAAAEGFIRMNEECFALLKNGAHKKGDVLGTARIAGIMGAKKTSSLIPLCHMVPLTALTLDFELIEESLSVKAVCRAKAKAVTGVEMEALTGVSTALLTVYDMCKAVDRAMTIYDIRLLKKQGGKSGLWEAEH